MAVNGNTRRVLSPVLLVGATSFAIVVGVGVARYAVADQQPQTSSVTTEVKANSSTDSGVNVHAEDSVSSQPTLDTSSDIRSTDTQGGTSNGSHASVTVNGETYTVSDGEQLQTTTTDSNGQTSINISVQSSGSGQQSSATSSNVHVFSHSFTTSQSNGSTSP